MNTQTFKRLEWSVAILLTIAVLVLLFVRAQHAGALWRDECASVQVALMPTLSDVLNNFQRESFPAFFHATIRGYSAVFGTSDGAFRVFGFVVGLMLMAVAWINSRLISGGPPLVSLALLGLNTTFLTWGTSIRGYGIGTVFILLALGLTAKMLLAPSRPRIIAAGLASLASVQFLLYNSMLLLAIAVAIGAVCLLRRHFRAAFAMTGIGVVCAVSVLPYFGPFWNESRSTIVFQGAVSPAWFWRQLNLALGDPSGLTTAVWIVLFAVAFVGAAMSLNRSWRQNRGESDLLVFGAVVSIMSILAYFVFLKVVNYGTREWYYLALISVLAGAGELLLAILSRIEWIRAARLAIVIVALIGMPLAAWPKVTERQTNMDFVAQQLLREAQARDLIVVNPWFFGVGFNWYYHGATPWITVPTMSDHKVHRFDLLKEKMMSPDAIADVREMISAALRAGNRVWFVGGVKLMKPGEAPRTLPPAPNSEFGWSCNDYSETWSEQLGFFLQIHAADARSEHVAFEGQVNALEDVRLSWFESWEE